MNTVLLSFDLEEFDMPFEYGKTISFDEQIDISQKGAEIILDILAENNVRATFFSTAIFASHALGVISRICAEGHEVASHGYFHSSFENQHLAESKSVLEKISGMPVQGFRMARMMPVSNDEILKAGYRYNSSINPTYLPGRYNNFFQPRTLSEINGVVQIPASVTPLVRLPLFWLSFHNFPLWFYKFACAQTMTQDHYLNLYFHPWEFMNISHSKFGLPRYVTKYSGLQMRKRFKQLIHWMKIKNYQFRSFSEFVDAHT